MDPRRTTDHPVSLATEAERARRAGLRRIVVLAYRDLDDPAAGGSEVHAHHVMAQLASVGLEVVERTVAAPDRPTGDRRDGYDVIRRGGRLAGVPSIALEGLRRRLPPADGLIEIWNGFPFWSPLWWRGPRVIVLHHLHDKLWEAFFPSPVDRVGSVIERRVAPWAYRGSPVATLAESGRRDLVARTPLREGQITVVPPGVHDRFHLGGPGERAEEPLVLAVGRLTSAKRFSLVIRTVARLRAEIPGLTLRIVGEGPERPVLEALVAELDLADTVHLMGRLDDDDLAAWYRRAWVVTSASISEGWGMTITEAAASGTPAVVTDIVGHRDAVGVGAGLLFEGPNDFEAALRKVLTDHDYRDELTSGADLAASELRWSNTAARILRLLVDDAARR